MDLPHSEAVGFSCADADATAAFLIDALGARVQGDPLEVDGGPYTELIGLPGARLRLRRLALGGEVLELSEVLELAPGARPGRPIPADSRCNDRWFQHICLVVNSMELALAGLRPALDAGRITAITTTPQRLPDWNTAAAGIIVGNARAELRAVARDAAAGGGGTGCYAGGMPRIVEATRGRAWGLLEGLALLGLA